MGYRDAPVGPITPLGSSGPGYYQTDKQYGAVGGPKLTGRKTGRVAPRDHIRQPAWEDTLQRHDLLPKHASQVGSNSSFDANQGQLFDPQTVAPRDARSDRDIARSAGGPTGEIHAAKSKQDPVLGATPGFMPGLTSKQKVKAIEAVGEGRAATGASRGGAPFAEIMEDRMAAGGKKADWYMGSDASGHRRDLPGEANKQVAAAAARTGSSYSNMARAVAMTSPQMGWKSEGTTDDPAAGQTDRMGSSAGTHPNLAVAEDVVRTTSRAMRRGSNVEEDLSARQFVSRDDRAAEMVRPSSFMVEHPSALGGTTHGRMKAGENRVREMQNPNAPMPAYPIQDIKSQKAANFDASLNLAHTEKAVQRIAATAYTVDRHDAALVGMDAESNEFKRRGVYEAVAMTGRRAALKRRELPPNEQASEWESHRAAKGLGQGNQFFTAGSNPPVPRPDIRDAAVKPAGSRNLKRRGGAIVPDDLTPF